MSDSPAQLGSMPYMGMGGYIPAPAQNGLKRQVVGALLEHLLGQALDTGFSKLNPNYAPMVQQATGATLPEPKWYQKNLGPQEAGQMIEGLGRGKYYQSIAKATEAKTPAEVAAINAGTEATKAGTAHTQAVTATVKPMSDAQIAEMLARTAGLNAGTQTENELRGARLEGQWAQNNNLNQQTAASKAMLPANLAHLNAETGNIQGLTTRTRELLPFEQAQMAAQTALAGPQAAKLQAETDLANQNVQADRSFPIGLQSYNQATNSLLVNAMSSRKIDPNSSQMNALLKAHRDYISVHPPSEAGENPAQWMAGYNRYIDMQLSRSGSSPVTTVDMPTAPRPYGGGQL